jgi:hypothetical protein
MDMATYLTPSLELITKAYTTKQDGLVQKCLEVLSIDIIIAVKILIYSKTSAFKINYILCLGGDIHVCGNNGWSGYAQNTQLTGPVQKTYLSGTKATMNAFVNINFLII